jgi:dTDP-4-dehydrorhamnose 3,5-epimerase
LPSERRAVKFTELALEGAFILDIEPIADARGLNARTFCEREFAAHGLRFPMVQTNVIHNAVKGTLRGFHWQEAPHLESKLFRCTRGAVYDVVIDMRPSSPTFEQWAGVELAARSRRQLYVPEQFAQAFLTLEDDTEMTYQTSEFHTPGAERGVKWDDPFFGVTWPADAEVLSAKDDSWPPYGSVL